MLVFRWSKVVCGWDDGRGGEIGLRLLGISELL